MHREQQDKGKTKNSVVNSFLQAARNILIGDKTIKINFFSGNVIHITGGSWLVLFPIGIITLLFVFNSDFFHKNLQSLNVKDNQRINKSEFTQTVTTSSDSVSQTFNTVNPPVEKKSFPPKTIKKSITENFIETCKQCETELELIFNANKEKEYKAIFSKCKEDLNQIKTNSKKLDGYNNITSRYTDFNDKFKCKQFLLPYYHQFTHWKKEIKRVVQPHQKDSIWNQVVIMHKKFEGEYHSCSRKEGALITKEIEEIQSIMQ